MKFDFLIVGSGLFGATFAYKARQAGKTCLVVDRRTHLGGNVYCEDLEGINVHKYGAHIFHTNNDDVWQFVNSIVPFNRYTNSPVARYKDKLFNLPFNMNTFHEMWPDVFTPDDARRKIDAQIKEAVDEINKQHAEKGLPPLTPSPMGNGWEGASNLEEQALLLVGNDIYEMLIKGYTEKQWGRQCIDLPSFIIKRLPVRLVYDNNYFNAKYQGIPYGGYNKLVSGLLEGIEVRTGCDYLKDRYQLDQVADKIIYTGALDEYFDYADGKLQYRTVRFETELLDTPNYQGNAVVNYTEREVPYTRIIEHKHFEMFGDEVYRIPKTVISREYSTEWTPGLEPYYPVNDTRNADRYARYADRARSIGLSYGGRMADYAYYDMDKVVERAHMLFSSLN